MESRLKQLIFMASLLTLLGCQQSPVYYHKHPARHVVVLDGKEISVLPLGEGRWEVYGKPVDRDTDEAEPLRLRQIRAIELVSRCRVDSQTIDVTGEPGVLRAKVQCPTK
jgi:hypothetical protein